jgi:hypothetical protein
VTDQGGGYLTVMMWKDKINVNIPTNLLSPPAEITFYDENESLKLAIIKRL